MIKLLLTVLKDDYYDDDIHCALDQLDELDYLSAGSLRKQSTGRHLAPIVHTIIITWEPVFALTLYVWVLSELMVFSMTRSEL